MQAIPAASMTETPLMSTVLSPGLSAIKVAVTSANTSTFLLSTRPRREIRRSYRSSCTANTGSADAVAFLISSTHQHINEDWALDTRLGVTRRNGSPAA